MKIAICIATYMRPKSLKELLIAIDNLSFKNQVPEVKIVVVDNDSKGHSKFVIDEVKNDIKWPLFYTIEPERGIPQARNTAVETAGDVDFIAFIDDDGIPGENWLDELLYVQDKYQADVVAGHVKCSFEIHPPQWVKKGGFFERKSKSTGSRVYNARTGNVLIKSSVFENGNRRFNEKMALTGGEDTHFFMGVSQSGYKMFWSNEAIVYDRIPGSRMTTSWILKRAYRVGNTLALCTRDYRFKKIDVYIRMLKGIGRIFIGVVTITPNLFLGKHAIVKSLQSLFKGFGTINGLLGVRYEEYKTIHGK